MSSMQKVMIIGNLGSDPQVRYTPDGVPVANFNVATSESWKDRNTGEKKEKTEWFRCVLWRKLGEIAGQYLKKGHKVYIEGKMETREWTDREGTKRWTTELIAREMKMLGDGRGNGDGDDSSKTNGQTNGQTNGGTGQPATQQEKPQEPPIEHTTSSELPPGISHDDLPF